VALPQGDIKSSSVTFLAFGDQGLAGLRQWRVAKGLVKAAQEGKGIDFVLLLGDNFYSRGVKGVRDSQWKYKFENVYRHASLAVPFYSMLGNHDYRGNADAQIEYGQQCLGSGRWRMPGKHYSVDFGEVNGRPLLRLVVLDTNWRRVDLEAEAAFVKQQVDDPRPVWKVVAGHNPVRSYGKNKDSEKLLQHLLPVLQAGRVDLYLSGHEHNQQIIKRVGEPAYVISGAAGRSPYRKFRAAGEDLLFAAASNGFTSVQATADRLTVQCRQADGTPLTEFLIEHNDSMDQPDNVNPAVAKEVLNVDVKRGAA